MTYPYGMKNAPAVGQGLGGLPRREVGGEPPIADVLTKTIPRVGPVSTWTSDNIGSDASYVLQPISFETNEFFLIESGSAAFSSARYTFDPSTDTIAEEAAVTVTGLLSSQITIYPYEPFEDIRVAPRGQFVQRTGLNTVTCGNVSGITGAIGGGNLIDGSMYFISENGIWRLESDMSCTQVFSGTLQASTGTTDYIQKIFKTDFGYLVSCVYNDESGAYAKVFTFDDEFSAIGEMPDNQSYSTKPAYSANTFYENGMVQCLFLNTDKRTFISFEVDPAGGVSKLYKYSASKSFDPDVVSAVSFGVDDRFSNGAKKDQLLTSYGCVGLYNDASEAFFIYKVKPLISSSPTEKGVGYVNHLGSYPHTSTASGHNSIKLPVMEKISPDNLVVFDINSSDYLAIRVLPIVGWQD